MLVVSRKANESIIINDNIKVTFLGFKESGGRGQVRIGIEAPDDVSIHREEVWNAIQKENKGTKS